MALKEQVFDPIAWTVQQKTQKYVYPIFSRRLRSDDEVTFLSWGYEEDPPIDLHLEESDESNRFPIQLYHRTAAGMDLAGKDVLEVGCGHGGGASYLMRTMRPASYTGIDLNAKGIEFCLGKHRLPGLSFRVGNAEDLPFPSESFDAVINIESSFHYEHFDSFLTEVARVLRPGGRFLYADLRPRSQIEQWESDLAGAPLREVSRTDITAEALRGLEMNSQQIQGLILRLPALVRPLARVFAQADATSVRRAVDSGEVVYRSYVFAKD